MSLIQVLKTTFKTNKNSGFKMFLEKYPNISKRGGNVLKADIELWSDHKDIFQFNYFTLGISIYNSKVTHFRSIYSGFMFSVLFLPYVSAMLAIPNVY